MRSHLVKPGSVYDGIEPGELGEVTESVQDRVRQLESRNSFLEEQCSQIESEKRYLENQKIKYEREIRKMQSELDRMKTSTLIIGTVIDVIKNDRILSGAATDLSSWLMSHNILMRKNCCLGQRLL